MMQGGRRTGGAAPTALVLVAAWAAAGGAARAHNTWILPHQQTLAPGASLTLDLTSGMKFPSPEASIDPNRIQKAACRLAGVTTELPDRAPGPTELRVGGRLEKAGVATIWVTLKPRALELDEEAVRHYLDEIGAGEAVRKEWLRDGVPGRWRELYVKHSKTLVRVGEPRDDRSWGEPVGLPLELVPETDPFGLKTGDLVTLRLLKEGVPLPDFPVAAARLGRPAAPLQRTDASGRVTVELDGLGPWMVSATEVRRSANPDADWESDFTTLTFRVRPKQAGAGKAKAKSTPPR